MPHTHSPLRFIGISPDREAATAPAQRHMSERELAERWGLSVRTLQRWRNASSGPDYLRLHRRIAYRLSDVERFEASHVCAGARS